MDENNVLDAEKELRIRMLEQENQKLKHEIIKCKILLNEIDSEANPDIISDEEAICVEQINRLKKISDDRDLSTDEAKKLDILHRNLKLARGEDLRVKSSNKAKKLSTDELNKIVQGK